MKELPLEFAGKGEVRGFVFTQVRKGDNAYIYKVCIDGHVSHYEVFRRMEFKLYETVSYPKSNQFGKTAYTLKTLNDAEAKFNELNVAREHKAKI